MKRIFALILALSILSGVFSVAYSETSVNPILTAATEKGFALGYLEKDSFGGFNYEIAVTRENFAGYLIRIMNFSSLEYSGGFSDVTAENPYSGAIETLSRMKILNGRGDGCFYPSGYMTVAEGVTALVRALGFEELALNNGGWYSGYYMIARECGLLSGVEFSSDKLLTNAELTILLSNFLDCEVFEVVSISENQIVRSQTKGKTVLSEYRGIYSVEDVLSENRLTTLVKPEGSSSEHIRVGDVILKSTVYDLTDYIGYRIRVYYDKDSLDIIWYELSEKNNVFTVDGTASPRIVNGVLLYEDNQLTEEKKIADSAVYIYNGKKLSVYNESLLNVTDGEMKLIDNNGDKKYDVISISAYQTGVIEAIDSDDGMLKLTDGRRIYFDKYSENDIYDTEGNIKTIAYLNIGDCILFTEDENKTYIKLVYERNKFSSQIIEMGNDGTLDYITLSDGKRYIATSDFLREFPNISPGDRGSFSLDPLGRIAGYKLNASDEFAYAYIISGKLNFKNLEYSLVLKLLTADNDILNCLVAKKVTIDGKETEKHQEVAEKLCGEGSSEIKPQIIRFKLNDEGQICDINTPVTEYNPEEAEPYDEQFRLSFDSGETAHTFYTSSRQFRGVSYLADNCAVFFVPTENATGVTEENYRSVSTDSIGNGAARKYVAYITDPEEKEPDAVVIRIDVSGDSESYGTYERISLIDKITEAVVDGERVNKVYYYYKGGYQWDYTDDLEAVEGRNPGDVVMFNFNPDGEIDNYKLFYDYEKNELARRVNESNVSELIAGNGYSSPFTHNRAHRGVLGTPLAIYSNLIELAVNNDPANPVIEGHRKALYTYTVTRNGDSLKIEEGSPEDIVLYKDNPDKCSKVFYLQTYYSAYDMVIYNEE